MSFSSKHNKYVSIPNWFSGIDTQQTVESMPQTRQVVGISGASGINAGDVQHTINLYNKFIVQYADVTSEILTLNNVAVIAVTVEGETTENTINVGTLVNAVRWKTSDFIEVAAGTTMTVTATIHSSYGVVFYDNTQTVISGTTVTQSTQQISVPENAYYFRISSNIDDTFALNYVQPKSYDSEQLVISDQNISDYLALNSSLPEGINHTQLTNNGISLLVQNPLYLTKDKNNIIKLSLDYSEIFDIVDEEVGSREYVTTDETEQDIQGVKTFVNGFKVGANKFHQMQDNVVYFDGNLAIRGGITTYANDGNADIPSIYDGIPIDMETLFWGENANGQKVLKSNSGTIKQVDVDGGGNALTSVTLSSDHSALMFGKNGVFAYQSTVDIIRDDLDELDTEFHDFKDYAETYYVTTHTEQEIYGKKNFTDDVDAGTGGLFVNGNQIIYNVEKGYWMLHGNLLITGGITTYANDGTGTPTLFEALPIDNKTIVRNEAGELTVSSELQAGLDEDQLKAFLDANQYATQLWVTSRGYATTTQFNTLESKVDDFLSGSDTDTIINKWKELEVFLSGLSESDNLATILGNKADKATTLAGYGITDAYTKSDVNTLLGDYVTLATAQTITGEKDFTGGLKVNGSPIVYDATNKYWKLEGDLLVTGGITMFADEGTYTPSTIMDSLILDDATLGINDEGKLYVKGGTGGGSIEGLATVATTGKYSDLIGVPTLLSSFTDDVVAGKYLPLSGGTLTSPLSSAILTIKREHNTGAVWIDFYNNTGKLGAIGIGGSGSPVAGDLFFHNPTLSKDLKVWHEGNDGSGSGLDADTLDGLQPSSLSVLSATKLTTARTIWGQSFNGTGNVDGTITITNTAGVSTFIKSFVSNDTPYTTIGGNDYPIIIGNSNGSLSLWKGENNRQLSLRRSGNIVFTTTTQSGWAPSFSIVKNDGVESIGNICGALGDTNNLTYYYYGGTYDAPAMVITPSFNMGLGTTSPTAKLHVVGTIHATTGISFARTYDGGFYNVIKSSGERDFIISNLSGSGKIYVQTNYNASTFDNLIITNNTATFGGKVGIGVSPTTMLSINQSAWDDGILLNRTVSGGGCGIKVQSNGTHIGTIGINGSKQLEVTLNEISTLLMDSDGKMNFTPGTAGRKLVINPVSSFINHYATTSGGWTMGLSYSSNSGTSFGTIGAFGDGGTFKYYFMGLYNGNRFQVDASGNGLFYGGVTMYSDIRKKTKLQDVELSLSQIANAPLIEHYYNSDEQKTTHVGSIAQYWAGMNDWFCKLDGEGYYTMEIQNAALASAISVARHLQKYETKTDRTIRKLKKRISELEDEVEKLKSA